MYPNVFILIMSIENFTVAQLLVFVEFIVPYIQWSVVQFARRKRHMILKHFLF